MNLKENAINGNRMLSRNTEYEKKKLRLQILEALNIKIKKPKIDRINFENIHKVLKCF